MDRIEKVLKKLSGKERKSIETLLKKIKNEDLQDLDLKKLRERGDIFRVRKGDLRIIYQERKDGGISILAIERRSEKTYKNF
jgi:mRNA-degrading endonuclease RelE of RelBE toxin-antitoxin system